MLPLRSAAAVTRAAVWMHKPLGRPRKLFGLVVQPGRMQIVDSNSQMFETSLDVIALGRSPPLLLPRIGIELLLMQRVPLQLSRHAVQLLFDPLGLLVVARLGQPLEVGLHLGQPLFGRFTLEAVRTTLEFVGLPLDLVEGLSQLMAIVGTRVAEFFHAGLDLMPTLLKLGMLVLESVRHLLVAGIAFDPPCQSAHFLLDLFGLLVAICFR